MEINVKLDNGFLPDAYGKRAPKDTYIKGQPSVSFPIEITDVPAGTKTLALTLVDPDSIPVCGFQWIHWTAANIPAHTTKIPANASQNAVLSFIQGKNSIAGALIGEKDTKINQHYIGPTPPDKTHDYELRVYALDTQLNLKNGFWMNELQHAMNGHIIDHRKFILPYEP